jgi:hypothetical protein|tara:strand:+ start:70 stop:321 length:252 start_codon:yes stop_codon:yes gene_type:complete
MKNEYLKIKARVVLTEIPVEVEFGVDPVFWLTSDQDTQCMTVWENLKISHPLVTEIAMQNTKLYPKSSWIENIRISGDHNGDY